MKRFIFVIVLIVFFIGCKNNEVRIDKFVYIEHIANRIEKPEDLKSKLYLEYDDNKGMIKIARTNVWSGGKTKYYSIKSPDSLRQLIFTNLHLKKYPTCFEDRIDQKNFPIIYDGDCFCIIYKFSDGAEQIINYEPYNVPDSLRSFTDYLEKIKKFSSFERIDSFNSTGWIDKYRDIIISCFPIISHETNVEFKPPVIVDSVY
ncbi:MAG TPA: hypothetical protein PKI01_05345 [Bacteroidales bacterium]|nr:hypothetical protein [Bacteroidales bacterium]